ncbi:YdeI/OmpD-associated family protein [Oleiagrimonas soli]|uniref:Membrane protein n=1 Tax=Oleiagrimonas soli TaxID=1543381 RepID=A0A099CYG1_9GAMM|nr:YdeI/OmpD-associated family protein [Oleiagrimonas soli]KGI78809.1 membrane protein [Oleiagrimonas soli]MBB6184412.1 hypothetical protein [Oleiagrimonas soli]
MTRSSDDIRCEAKLLRPKHPGRGGSWSFLVLPKAASAKLPTRGQTFVEGTLNGQPFRAMLEPDGCKSHWLKVDRALRERAQAEPNEIVALTLSTDVEPPEPTLPTDLRQALAKHPEAASTWSDITCAARWDWLHWITSAKREETRARRIANACDMLASGKRRVCCFDRSGFYSKEFSAPEAAE